MLDVFGITRFLSNPGSPYDDAVVESTNRLVKKEPICDNVYTSVERLRSDANRYVWWYNHQRLHSTLGYMNPVEFTQQGVFSQVGVSCFVTDFFHCGKTLPNPPGKSGDDGPTSSEPSGLDPPTPGSRRPTTGSRSPSAWPMASTTSTTSSPSSCSAAADSTYAYPNQEPNPRKQQKPLTYLLIQGMRDLWYLWLEKDNEGLRKDA